MGTYISAEGILVNDNDTVEISSSLYDPPLKFTIIDSKICPVIPVEYYRILVGTGHKPEITALAELFIERDNYLQSVLKLDKLNIANNIEKFKQNAIAFCKEDHIPILMALSIDKAAAHQEPYYKQILTNKVYQAYLLAKYPASNLNAINTSTTSNMIDYIGAYWNKQLQMWSVAIEIGDRKIIVGAFANKYDATSEYNKALLAMISPKDINPDIRDMFLSKLKNLSIINQTTTSAEELNDTETADNLATEDYLNLDDIFTTDTLHEPETITNKDTIEQPSSKMQKTVDSRPLNIKHSNYLGITWDPKRSVWKAYLFFKGQHLISAKQVFKTEEEAVMAYNKAIRDYMNPDDIRSKNLTLKERNALIKKINVISPTMFETLTNIDSSQKTEKTSSHYRGVSFDPIRRRWRAQLLFKGISIIASAFKTEDAAAIAYNNAITSYIDRNIHILSTRDRNLLEKKMNSVIQKSNTSEPKQATSKTPDIIDNFNTFDVGQQIYPPSNIFDSALNNNDDFGLFDEDPEDMELTPKATTLDKIGDLNTFDVEPEVFVQSSIFDSALNSKDDFGLFEDNPAEIAPTPKSDKQQEPIPSLVNDTMVQPSTKKNTETKSSIYRGVSWEKDKQKWRSELVFRNKYVLRARFKSEKQAAMAYNEAISVCLTSENLTYREEIALKSNFNQNLTKSNTGSSIQPALDNAPNALFFSTNKIHTPLNQEPSNVANTARGDLDLSNHDNSLKASDEDLYDALQHLIEPPDKTTGKHPRS